MDPAPGSKYCAAHGGNKAIIILRKQALAMYRTNHYLESMRELGKSPDILTLNQEVVLIKAMIQEKLNMIHDLSSAAMNSGPLVDMIMKCEKLVSSCTRLNDRLKLTLSAEQAMQWVGEIVQIISEEVPDGDTLTRIQKRISESTPGESTGIQRLEHHQ